ncbi:MAG: ribosome maturation factor RimP [Alphaproteobacteria bacterium]|nr:ribosome maturation factor RimP [Alphaproteobacteria bacterium]
MEARRPTLQDPEGRFAPIIEPVALAHGCRLVHVRVGGSQAGKGNALEVFLERNDGTPLTMDTCSQISREVSALLDVEDAMKGGAYRLEVGSAGLDRPMTHIADFIRFKGYDVKIEFRRPLADGQKKIRGTITDANAESFTIVDDNKRSFTLGMGDVAAARLVADDALLNAVQKGQFPKPINIDEYQPTKG